MLPGYGLKIATLESRDISSLQFSVIVFAVHPAGGAAGGSPRRRRRRRPTPPEAPAGG
jgi:hypothetical protein